MRVFRKAVADRLAGAGLRVVTDRQRFDDSAFPAPWVVLDFPSPALAHDRWEASDFHRSSGWFQTASVGESIDQADWMHEKVTSQLLDWVPLVDDWQLWPVRMDLTAAVVNDGESSLPDRRLVEVVMRWTWQAERAA